jgi:hypothetical protein
VSGDLSNAHKYFSAPVRYYLLATEGVGSLEERGAMWLFLRYLVDQTAVDTSLAEGDSITRRLVQTARTGATNVEAITGVPFDSTVTRWALANYVSDLSGFTAPSELQYKTWKFRTVYPTLAARCSGIPSSFPLVPAGPASGSTVNLSDTLRAGSGMYFRGTQSASEGGFTLLFSDGRGFALPSTIVPRLNVLRIK